MVGHLVREHGYAIERCTGSGCTDFVEVARVAADAVSYTDTGLAATSTYRHRVRAFNDIGFSDYSVAEATTAAGATAATRCAEQPDGDGSLADADQPRVGGQRVLP